MTAIYTTLKARQVTSAHMLIGKTIAGICYEFADIVIVFTDQTFILQTSDPADGVVISTELPEDWLLLRAGLIDQATYNALEQAHETERAQRQLLADQQAYAKLKEIFEPTTRE